MAVAPVFIFSFSISLITVNGTAKYDLPANDIAEVTIPVQIPEGYYKLSLIKIRSGSSRGVLVSYVFTESGVTAIFRNVGSAHSDRTAEVTVMCYKGL